MNRGKLSLAVFATALIVLPLTPRAAQAWGANGHRIVAKIGQDNLSPAAHAAVVELAGGESLALLATWPDFIRSFSAWDCVKPWHHMTVEDDETFEQGMARPPRISRGCDEELFNRLGMPSNVVEAIDYFSAIAGGDEEKGEAFGELLEGSGVEPYRGSVRLTALALLVHFVGDVHQPLHVGRGGDRGGNSITTEWFGELTKLHSLWDSGMIEKEELSYSEFAAFLEQEFADQGPVDYGSGPATWAQESISHRAEVYDIGDDRNPAANLSSLSYEYAAAQNALLKQRLYRGGRRLALLLNSIFDGDSTGGSDD